jgi:hypothetical protein
MVCRRDVVGEGGSVIFGIYLSFFDLRCYADSLKEIGFRINDISVLCPQGALSTTAYSYNKANHEVEGGAFRSEGLMAGPLGRLTCLTPPPTGELAGALMGLGIPPYAAERYEARIKTGGILTAVRSPHPSMTECVCEILAKTGAVGILISRNAKADTISQLVSQDTSPQRFGSRNTIPKQTPVNHWATRG